MNITYEESLRLKGIAILMMIWLHCFNSWINPDYSYEAFVYIGNYPLAYRISYIAGSVVPLYCFLSGYGLTKKRPFNFSYVSQKIWKLLRMYWLVLTFFIGVTFLVDKTYYDFSIRTLLENYLSINPTFNGSLWFLFPYILLFVSSNWIFKILDRYIVSGIIIILFMFLFSNYILKKEALNEIDKLSIGVKQIMNFFKILFPFSLGYIAAHYNIKFLYNDIFLKNRIYIGSGLFIIVLSKLFISSYAMCYIYVIPLILFFHYLKYNYKIDNFLCSLGRYSTYMWFIHAYFTDYIFHTYVYEMKYPFFIFIFVVTITYILSFFFEKIYNAITGLKSI